MADKRTEKLAKRWCRKSRYRGSSAAHWHPASQTRSAAHVWRLSVLQAIRATVSLCLLVLAVPSVTRAELSVTPDNVQSGSLLLKMRDGYELATRINSDIELHVSGMTVRATLKQNFRNDGSEWVEGVYVFPLPEAAAVDRMRVRIGERVIEGEIQEKEKARAQYEAAKRAGKRASLVNQQRANLFTTRVANIGPGETIEIEIQFLDTARYDDGTFTLRFPTTLTPRYIPGALTGDRQGSGWSADTDQVEDASLITPPQLTASDEHRLSLTAVIDAGMPLDFVASRYHPIKVEQRGHVYDLRFSLHGTQMDHDVELFWRPPAQAAPQALVFAEQLHEQPHLTVMLMPPTDNETPVGIVPRELIFVIDTSGSMHGVSIAQAKRALLLALDGLRPVDRFNVIQFNSTTEALFPTTVVADGERLRQAREYVQALAANGGTEMLPALRLALAMGAGSDYLQQLIFITDGSVGNEAEMYTLIERDLGATRLFTVGIGSAPNGWFMSKAAQMGRGSHVMIGALHEVEEKMGGLFEKLERPQVTDITVDWPAGVEATAYPAKVPDLYAGEPVVLKARLQGPLEKDARLAVSGRSVQGDWVEEIPLAIETSNPGTAAIWARAHIAEWLDRGRRGAAAEEVRAAVVDTALRYHLVSKFTSLVAVDKTPVRPANAGLAREQVPNLLPHGQSQQAIFGFPATATRAPQQRLLGTLCLLLGTLWLFYRVWTVRGLNRARD